MRTAYLLAVFRLDGDVPVFIGTEVFSEPSPSMSPGRITFEVHADDGPTFEIARHRLLSYAQRAPHLQWALRSLVQR